MLSATDLTYAETAATDWYCDQYGGFHSEYDDIDLCRAFGEYVRYECATAQSLDVNLPSLFRVWDEQRR